MSPKIIKDLRGDFGAARDQGDRPTCLPFAASDAHAAARKTQSFEALSAEYLFYHGVARTKHKNPNRGISLQVTTSALKCDGQPVEAGWPYLASLPKDLSTWKPPSSHPIHRTELKHASAADLKKTLGLGQPLLAILKLSESFYQPTTEGIVEIQNPDPDTGLHAVIVVGHGELKSEGMILVRNSWGTGWGLAGYGWLYERYLMPRLHSLALI